MSNKVKQTTRKFYNKWTYKLSFSKKGLAVLRWKPIEDAIESTDDQDIKSLFTSLSKIEPEKYCKRCESSILDIYTNDESVFSSLYEKHQSILKQAFAPKKGSEDLLLDEKHVILAKKLPHDRYQYKVFLQPHKISSQEEKNNFINWLSTQEPRVNVTETVKEWFYKTSWNWDRRYMYVEDDKTLLLIKLKNSQALGTIYTYKVSDK